MMGKNTRYANWSCLSLWTNSPSLEVHSILQFCHRAVCSIKEAHPPQNPSMTLGNNWTIRNVTIKAPMKHKLLILSHFRNICSFIFVLLSYIIVQYF